ncbi:hypothetical protein Tco_0287389 [Tanacetum coccineum]
MFTPVIYLSLSKPASSTTQAPIFTATTSTTTTTRPLPPPPLPQQQSTTDSELDVRVRALEQNFTAFEQKIKNLDNTTQNLGSRVFTLELRDLPHKIDESVYENVKEAREEFFAERDKSCKRRRDDQDPSPPPPDFDPSKKRRHDSGTSGSSQPPAIQLSAWKSTDTRDAPSSSSKQQSGPHSKQPVKDISMLYTASIFDSEETSSIHLPHIKPRPEWLNPIPEDDRPATPKPMFMNWYCQKMGKTELTQADLEGQAYEVVKAFYPNVVQLQIDISRPLPLSGPPGHATIQTQFFFNNDLDYLRYGNKGNRQALSISKMKAACYHDFGLELLVPEHMWINDACTYEISASYGISHWWFNRQKFYIDQHTTDSSRKIVRTHMRILSVVRIKAYSRYGYDYLKEITLCRADYQEYMIAEKDFKNLYPCDFEDLNLLLLQGHLNHLPSSNKRMLSVVLNLTKPGWDAKGYEYKHDYTIIESPRTIMFPVSNNERKIMRFNEIYKFSDGILTNILEALDYRVNEYKKRSKCENKGRVLTEMELELEQTQQGTSHEVSVQVKMEMDIPRSSGV